MCGLVGYSTAANEPDLEAGLSSIAHRGPDGSGVMRFAEHGAGLGHVRLSIIDLSPTGAQPMASDDGRLVLSYNGEIYNFRELRAELSAAGVSFRGRSDTEVLLRLIEHYGLSALPRLNGIFAFALFDRESGEFTLVRDRMGVKPLYVLEEQRRVLFASEIKAFVAMGGELGPWQPDAIARYLTFLWCPGRGTPTMGVSKLCPGEAMTIRAGQVLRRWRWSVQETPRHNKSSTADLISATRDCLRAAVHRQMIADVPVGAFLSGGLDSSAVAAFARERDQNLRCFSIDVGGAEEGSCDDLPYARKAAAHLKVELDVIHVDASELAHALPEMVHQLDEPLADPAPLNVLFISRLARRRGIKVLLSGAGGDDVFSGYRRHRALALERYWSWAPASVRREVARASSALGRRRAWSRRLAKAFTAMNYDGAERIASYYFWIPPEISISLLSSDVRAHLRERPQQPILDFIAQLPEDASPLERMLSIEKRFFLGDHNLVYTDKMSMAEGVEVRVPFLDEALLDFAATIPSSAKQHGATGKWILKKAMEPLLPREIVYRPKTGFGLPLRRWLHNELKDFVAQILARESLDARGLFDAHAVEQLVAQDRAGRIDGTYAIFALICIELWMREFVDAPQRTRQAAA